MTQEQRANVTSVHAEATGLNPGWAMGQESNGRENTGVIKEAIYKDQERTVLSPLSLWSASADMRVKRLVGFAGCFKKNTR